MISTLVKNEQKHHETTCPYCQLHQLECIPPPPPVIRLLLTISPRRFSEDYCLRQPLTLISIFASFPLYGICITDFTFTLIGPGYHIPAYHYFIGLFLLLVIASSFIIVLLHSKPKSVVFKYLASKIRH